MISVIVPIYNVEKYLPQCLESIIGQTYTELEIILVDDGSTDSCGNICDTYALRDCRIKVIHKKNGGLVSARKAGVDAASGEYVGYVDGDDWIEPDMFEWLFQTIRTENVDIAMCGRFEDTGKIRRKVYQGIPAGRYDKRKLTERVYPNMIVNGAFFEWGIFPGVWDKLFRRELLERFQMAVDERLTMGEDAACTYPCMLNADSVCILHECLYHYRQISSSMVRQRMSPGQERYQFSLLYQTVLDALVRFRGIYDLTGQWKEYLLFLMTPRADTLLEGNSELDYLFPFPGVKRGSRIILYGMGTYGQRLYKFVKETEICALVTAVDRSYAELEKQGISVEAPECIGKYDFDAIVIACSFASTRNAIYRELALSYGENKVHVMDEKLIKSKGILDAFGLNRS